MFALPLEMADTLLCSYFSTLQDCNASIGIDIVSFRELAVPRILYIAAGN